MLNLSESNIASLIDLRNHNICTPDKESKAPQINGIGIMITNVPNVHSH